MHPALYFAMLFFSVIIFPWWMVRRMQRVKEMMRSDDTSPRSQDTDEFISSEGGLVYGKKHALNEDLLSADKSAAAMPDIVKTLEGRR